MLCAWLLVSCNATLLPTLLYELLLFRMLASLFSDAVCCAVQVQRLAINYERAEAAAKLEAEVAVEEAQTQLQAGQFAQQQLHQQLAMREQQTEARLAAAADALTAATAEIEQLSMQLLQAQQDLQQQREQRQQQQLDEVSFPLLQASPVTNDTQYDRV